MIFGSYRDIIIIEKATGEVCYFMAFDVVPAKNDVVFKSLFVKHTDILKNFISDVLDIPFEEITELKILNPELPPAEAAGKLIRLDINLQTTSRNINIEMQSARDDDYAERILYYWAELFTDSLKKGESYNDLSQTISMSVLGFDMFDCKEYHSHFSILENSRYEPLTDKLAIHFFELGKLGRLDPNNRSEIWLHLINAESEAEFDMLKNTNIPIINESVNAILEMSKDEKMREYIRQRNKAERDYESGLINAKRQGRAEGIQIGIAQGEAKATKRFIDNLKAKGMSEEEIRKMLEI